MPPVKPTEYTSAGADKRTHGIEDLGGTHGKGFHFTGAGNGRGPARCHIHRPQGPLSQVIGGREQAFAVARPRKRGDGAVPILRQRPLSAALRVDEHQMKAIRLESRSILCKISQLCTVGREGRLRIPGLVVGGEIARHGARVRRHHIDIEIGRPGFAHRAAHRKHHLRAIRAELIVFAAAEGFARHITQAGGEVHRRSGGGSVGAERQCEHLRAPAITPGVPMAHKNISIQGRRSLERGLFCRVAVGCR